MCLIPASFLVQTRSHVPPSRVMVPSTIAPMQIKQVDCMTAQDSVYMHASQSVSLIISYFPQLRKKFVVMLSGRDRRHVRINWSAKDVSGWLIMAPGIEPFVGHARGGHLYIQYVCHRLSLRWVKTTSSSLLFPFPSPFPSPFPFPFPFPGRRTLWAMPCW